MSIECVKKNSLPEFTFPDELTLKYEFAARPGMPPVTVYWYHYGAGDAYTPPGMTPEEARKIPGQGPQVGPAAGEGGFRPGSGGRPGAGGGRPPAGSGYNSIFVGSKGYLGTSGRGEGVGLLPARVGPSTSSRSRICSARPVRVQDRTMRPIRGIGSAPAKAVRRLARTSASRLATPSGWWPVRRRFTMRASSFGTTRKASSPIIQPRIAGSNRRIARVGS